MQSSAVQVRVTTGRESHLDIMNSAGGVDDSDRTIVAYCECQISDGREK